MLHHPVNQKRPDTTNKRKERPPIGPDVQGGALAAAFTAGAGQVSASSVFDVDFTLIQPRPMFRAEAIIRLSQPPGRSYSELV